MATHHSASLWAVLGASGSGKGEFVKRSDAVRASPRLLIWDTMDEYGKFAKRAKSVRALAKACLSAGSDGPLRARYIPRGSDAQVKQDFDVFCRIAFAWKENTTVIEELSTVTTASHAPKAWRDLCLMGRHKHIHVIGVSQFPALIDKCLMGNATLIHTGALRNARHRQAVAAEMDGVTVEEIGKMLPLDWIKNLSTGEVTRGRLQFSAKNRA